MEAGKLFSKQLFSFLHHDERSDIFLLLVKGRIWLNGALVIAVWMRATVGVSLAHSFFAIDASLSKQVNRQFLEEERLQLDEDGLYSVCGGPSLIDLFLLDVKDVKTNGCLVEHVGVGHWGKEADRGWRDGVVLGEGDLQMEHTALEGGTFGATQVCVPDV